MHGRMGKRQSRRAARQLVLDGELAGMRWMCRRRTGHGRVEVAAGFASSGGAAARGPRKEDMDFSLLFLWKDTEGVYEQVEFFCRDS